MKLARKQLLAQVIKIVHMTWLVNVPFRSERVTFADILEKPRIAKMAAAASDNDQGFIGRNAVLIFSLRKGRTISVVRCYVEYV